MSESSNSGRMPSAAYLKSMEMAAARSGSLVVEVDDDVPRRFGPKTLCVAFTLFFGGWVSGRH